MTNLNEQLRRIEPRFWWLVREARSSIEDFDSFDVDSGNPESVVVWKQLGELNSAAALELIHYVLQHADELQKCFVPQTPEAS